MREGVFLHEARSLEQCSAIGKRLRARAVFTFCGKMLFSLLSLALPYNK
jgi:hypothetical protein